MNAVLIACAASTLFCSLYTIILPTWDAMAARRKSRTQRRVNVTTSAASGTDVQRNTAQITT